MNSYLYFDKLLEQSQYESNNNLNDLCFPDQIASMNT